MKLKPLPIVAALIGLLLIVCGVMYVTQTAGSLPSFFPGYAAGSAAKHMKHAIACFVVAVCCFVFVWFQAGPKPTSSQGK